MNYRSAVLYGAGTEVTDPDEKLTALAALVDKAAPGRTREARAPTSQELSASLVVRLPVVEASAKVRTGPPLDGPELLSDDCWAGVLPLRTQVLPPVDDVQLRAGTAPSVAAGERARTFTSAAFAPYERTEGELLVSTDPERIDFALVHRFLSDESYWARGVEAWRQRLAMSHSISFGLYRRGEQIGFARVVTDHGRVAYLADVFVVSQARGQGFARPLIAAVLDHPGVAGVDRWLLGTADAHGLYERFGFERVEGRYMIRRRKSQAGVFCWYWPLNRPTLKARGSYMPKRSQGSAVAVLLLLPAMAWAGRAAAQDPSTAAPPAPAASGASTDASAAAPAPAASAQDGAAGRPDKDKLAPNSIYLEGLGAAIGYSLNYERMVVDELGVRVGFSYLSVGASASAGGTSSSASATYIFIPVTASYVGIRYGRSALELGGGVTMLYVSANANAAGVATSGAGVVPYGVLMVGYRFQPVDHAGFMFRIGANALVAPGLGLQNPTPGQLGVIPWPYISLGASF